MAVLEGPGLEHVCPYWSIRQGFGEDDWGVGREFGNGRYARRSGLCDGCWEFRYAAPTNVMRFVADPH